MCASRLALSRKTCSRADSVFRRDSFAKHTCKQRRGGATPSDARAGNRRDSRSRARRILCLISAHGRGGGAVAILRSRCRVIRSSRSDLNSTSRLRHISQLARCSSTRMASTASSSRSLMSAVSGVVHVMWIRLTNRNLSQFETARRRKTATLEMPIPIVLAISL